MRTRSWILPARHLSVERTSQKVSFAATVFLRQFENDFEWCPYVLHHFVGLLLVSLLLHGSLGLFGLLLVVDGNRDIRLPLILLVGLLLRLLGAVLLLLFLSLLLLLGRDLGGPLFDLLLGLGHPVAGHLGLLHGFRLRAFGPSGGSGLGHCERVAVALSSSLFYWQKVSRFREDERTEPRLQWRSIRAFGKSIRPANTMRPKETKVSRGREDNARRSLAAQDSYSVTQLALLQLKVGGTCEN